MADQLSALKGLELAITELTYVATLWAKMENETHGRHEPDGTFVVTYDSYDAAGVQSFLGYDLERRTAALRRDFLACFALPTTEEGNG